MQVYLNYLVTTVESFIVNEKAAKSETTRLMLMLNQENIP